VTLFSEIAGRPSERGLALRDEVARNLERICRTRRGALLLAREYGTGDVTALFHSFPEIDSWAAALERTIARYEPRLGNVRVVPVISDSLDLTLRAEIRGVLRAAGRPSDARFSATLDPQLRVHVR
jgi:type VI secretion system lysozyme-like protein